MTRAHGGKVSLYELAAGGPLQREGTRVSMYRSTSEYEQGLGLRPAQTEQHAWTLVTPLGRGQKLTRGLRTANTRVGGQKSKEEQSIQGELLKSGEEAPIARSGRLWRLPGSIDFLHAERMGKVDGNCNLAPSAPSHKWRMYMLPSTGCPRGPEQDVTISVDAISH